RHYDRVVAGDLDDAAAADQPQDAVATPEGMTRHVEDLRPLAVGPYRYGVTLHIPNDRAIVEESAAQVSRRLVAPDLADVADVQQPRTVVAEQHRGTSAHAVVERPGPENGQAVALEVLIAHHVLSHLAHRVGREGPERVGLPDRQLVIVDEPVLLAASRPEKARGELQRPQRLEQVDLREDVRGQRLGRRLPGCADEALGRE